MKYDFAIEHLIKLKEVLKNSLAEWENNKWIDNEIREEMIRTYKGLIQETEEEIEVYDNAKETGYIITRESRQKLREIEQNKQNDENER